MNKKIYAKPQIDILGLTSESIAANPLSAYPVLAAANDPIDRTASTWTLKSY